MTAREGVRTRTAELEPIEEAALTRLRAEFGELEGDVRERESVDPERIWAAVHGELAPEECAEIVDRLHLDPALALEWRLALALREPELAEPAKPAANDRSYARSFGYVGALGLLAAAALLLIVLPSEPDPPRERGTPIELGDGSGGQLREAQTEAAIASELREPELSAAAFELRWTPVPGALRYELQLTTEALDPVFAAPDLSDNHALVPASALASLDPGTELVWRVIAVMPDGQRRSSAALSVTLK
jgi:hypothetical protein